MSVKKQVAIGYDHRGAKIKDAVIGAIKAADCGISFETEASDYPVAAISVAAAVNSSEDESDCGILICGTGIGMCIAANKVVGIRAAHAATRYQSQMSREHNNANVLCLGSMAHDASARIEDLVTLFLETEFSDEHRHCNRLETISKFENGRTCLENLTS